VTPVASNCTGSPPGKANRRSGVDKQSIAAKALSKTLCRRISQRMQEIVAATDEKPWKNDEVIDPNRTSPLH
jgi:hypothetical protein